MITKHTLLDPAVEERLAALPSIGDRDGSKGDLPAVKIFDPMGQAFWVIWEYDTDEQTGYGLCDLGFGFPEVGYVSLTEVREVSADRPIPFEQDISVSTRFEGYRSRQVDIPGWMQQGGTQ